MSKSRSQDIKSFRGGEREVGIPWGGGSPGGRGALKRSLGSGLLPRPSNPTPFHFVIVFKTKQFFLKLRSCFVFPIEVQGELDPLSFHNLCSLNKTKFERNSPLEYYHMIYIGTTKHTS